MRRGAALVGLLLLAGAAGCGTARDAGRQAEPAHSLTPSSSSTSPGTPTAAASSAPGDGVRRVTLALTGDVLIHNTVWASAEREGSPGRPDFRPMLAPMRDRISSADLALCHLETPLAPAGGPWKDWPRFAAPPAILPALVWAGYDGCTTASNHTIDQGFDGVVRTLDALDAAGLAHAGTARTEDESREITVLTSHGLRIAWLSYTWSLNGWEVEPGREWSVNMIDVPRILDDARRAKDQGADAVIVALHWGEEYWNTPSDWQLDVAEQLTKPGIIDLVYGHHTHLVQPVRTVNGTPVIFGLGNFVADQRGMDPGTDTGLLAEVTLMQRGDGPVRVGPLDARPLLVCGAGSPGCPEQRTYDVADRLAADPPPLLRTRLLSSQAKARDALSR